MHRPWACCSAAFSVALKSWAKEQKKCRATAETDCHSATAYVSPLKWCCSIKDAATWQKRRGDFYPADFARAAVHTFDHQVEHVSSPGYSELEQVWRVDVIEYGNMSNYVMFFDAEGVSSTTAMLEHLKQKHPGVISQNGGGARRCGSLTMSYHGLCVWSVCQKMKLLCCYATVMLVRLAIVRPRLPIKNNSKQPRWGRSATWINVPTVVLIHEK